MTNKLRPCPFCGNKDIWISEWKDFVSIKCGQCETKVGASDEKTAVEYWNHRPIEDALRAENEKWREQYSEATMNNLEKINECNRLEEEVQRLQEELEKLKQS